MATGRGATYVHAAKRDAPRNVGNAATSRAAPVTNTVATVGGGDIAGARVAVTYPAPHGAESLLLSDGEIAAFGRGGACAIRFGHAPIADLGVPRLAGRLVVAARRVFVESEDSPGRTSLEITSAGRAPVLLAIGEGYAPSETEFRVTVHGERQTWTIAVAVRRDEADVAGNELDAPTRTFDLHLTNGQRRVLDAYMEPMRRGRLEPATHRDVAAALDCHPNSAREALYEVWSKLFAAGIPMPDIAEKRVAVVEAVRLHRLLETNPDDA